MSCGPSSRLLTMRSRQLVLVLLAGVSCIGALVWWMSRDAREHAVPASSSSARPVDDEDRAIASKLDTNAPTTAKSAVVGDDDAAHDVFLVAKLVNEQRDLLAGLELGVTLQVRSVKRGNASVSQPVTTDSRGVLRVPCPIAAAS